MARHHDRTKDLFPGLTKIFTAKKPAAKILTANLATKKSNASTQHESSNNNQKTSDHVDSRTYAQEKLWLACAFPQLALDALVTTNPTAAPTAAPTATVVCDSNDRKSPIIACNDMACRQALFPGMPLGVAMSLSKTVTVLHRNRNAEKILLQRIATAATRLSPEVSLEDDTLLIEIGGSLKLFGNLASLMEHAETLLGSGTTGFQAACATTPAAAQLFAENGSCVWVTDPNHLASAVSRLPLHSLKLSPKIHLRLSGMGIVSIEDLLRLPRDGLARRTSPQLIERLDKILGRIPDLRNTFVSRERFSRLKELDNVLEDLDSILRTAKPMLDDLAHALRHADASVDRINWTLTHQKSPATQVSIRLSEPTRDAHFFYKLTRDRMEQTELPEGVDSICLNTAGYTENRPTSLSLFPDLPHQQEPDNTLIDRLRARLGDNAVQGLSLVDEHRPEFAWRGILPHENKKKHDTPHQSEPPKASLLRPLWLLPAPQKLEIENGAPVFDGTLRLSSHQERIETGWWDMHSMRRDYYIAIDTTGVRLWIFRDLSTSEDWYLQGIFG